jgi:hypothetical protein
MLSGQFSEIGTPMKETDSVSERLLYLNHLKRLSTGEHFAGFIRRGN